MSISPDLKPQKLKRVVSIIGSMKCGTTTLFDLMGQHPQLCPSTIKETNFIAHPERWAWGMPWFEGLFEGFDPEEHAFALEASTDLAKLPYTDYVFERLKRVDGIDWRFIYMIRNPFERIQSHHLHAHNTGFELLHLRPSDSSFSFDDRISPVALNITRYADHIERYQAEFGADKLKVLLFEDLIADPSSVISDVCDFLGLEADGFDAEPPHSNKRRWQNTQAWRKLRKNPVLSPIKNIVPGDVRRAARQRFGKEQIEGRFELSESEKEQISSELAYDWRRLRDVHGLKIEEAWKLSIPEGP